MVNDWTEDEVKILREMLAEGCSARTVGIAVRRTRNAVIGKAHRLRIALNPPPPRRQRAAPPVQRVPDPQRSNVPVEEKKHDEVVVVARKWRPFLNRDVADACQWPIGDVGSPEFHFCGEDVVTGKHYCAQHYALSRVGHQEPRGGTHYRRRWGSGRYMT